MDPLVAQGSDYDHRSDFYSYCAVAYEVLSGQFLPRIERLITVLNTTKNVRPPFPESISNELRAIFLSGFEENPDKRLTLDDAIDCLSKF